MKIGVFVLDTLRYDTFKKELTAVREAADREFTEMYSTSRWTPPAHASLYTGVFPSEAGTSVGETYFQTDLPSVAEQFRDAGFDTTLITNNGYVDPFFNYDVGFENVYRGPNLAGRPDDGTDFDWREFKTQLPDSGIRRYLAALKRIHRSDYPTARLLSIAARYFLSAVRSENAESIAWVEDALAEPSASNDDEFVFANLMPCHFPYSSPAAYREHDVPVTPPLQLTLDGGDSELVDQYRDCYSDAAVYLNDVLVEQLFTVDWDLLFVLSDHGEQFGEHDLYGHFYGCYPELTHVPCVAFGDTVPRGTSEDLHSILDVHRSVLEFAGIEPHESARGVDLLADDVSGHDSVYAESTGCVFHDENASGIHATVPDEWDSPQYFVRDADGGTLTVDYDGPRVLSTGGDRSTAEVRTDLQRELETVRASLKSHGDDESETELTDAVEDRLERLGYR